MSPYRARRSYAPDSAEQHRTWLSLIEVSGYAEEVAQGLHVKNKNSRRVTSEQEMLL